MQARSRTPQDVRAPGLPRRPVHGHRCDLRHRRLIIGAVLALAIVGGHVLVQRQDRGRRCPAKPVSREEGAPALRDRRRSRPARRHPRCRGFMCRPSAAQRLRHGPWPQPRRRRRNQASCRCSTTTSCAACSPTSCRTSATATSHRIGCGRGRVDDHFVARSRCSARSSAG